MPLVQTRGAASAQGFGEFAQAATAVNYIEDVFSTYLYTGNSSTQTITNNIDLSTKGGLVWIKGRNYAGTGHFFQDTVRGANQFLDSTTTGANQDISGVNTVFTTTGFSQNNNFASFNESAYNYVSWTWRKQPKFFDVVTYTGNGANRTIAHSLGSVPGSIWVKRTDTTGDWQVYHRSLANTQYLVLNSTAAAATGATRWNSTTPTSTEFSLGTDVTVNASAGTYVAYLFAHDAGGFGLTGTDNVISCGSFTTNGSGVATVNLGYEPQFVLFKRTDSAGHSWEIIDTMRGFSVNSNGTSGNVQRLNPNSSGAETNSSAFEMYLTSTGFATNQYFYNATYIYIAIRRGPMKVPTTGTSVFAIDTLNGSPLPSWTSGFPVDMALMRYNVNTADDIQVGTRLIGAYQLLTPQTAAETANATFTFDYNDGWGSRTGTVSNWYSWMMRRAPSFFDVVCYTGAGTSATTFSHNLQKQPELIIVKSRSTAQNWSVAFRTTGSTYIWGLDLNTTAAGQSPFDYGANMSASIFDAYIGTTAESVNSGTTYVAYLFATCAGVSKVGSYTGTGTTLQIDCGFTSGARFVMIKRNDSTGDWYVWDTARGIVSGNDPYLLLNSTAAEVTNTDYIDTYSAGFEISSTAPAAINANGGTYLFLAIA